MKTLLIGDSHGHFDSFFRCVTRGIEAYGVPDQIVSVGDFGCYPKYRTFDNRGFNVRFIDGNHEDHDSIADGSYASAIAAQHIRRGTAEGNVLYVGGADSIDKVFQIANNDWYAAEAVTESDVERCKLATGIRLVVAHDMPSSAYLRHNKSCNTSSPHLLENVCNALSPTFWVHGHHHRNMIVRCNSTWVVGLDSTHGSSNLLDAVAFYDGRSLFVNEQEVGYSWEI